MLHLEFTNYDVWMADCIINLWNLYLYRMFWISNAVPYFQLNRMSCSRKVYGSSGISGHLFSYCQGKCCFFFTFVYNLVMLYLEFTNYDVWMADFIINLWNLYLYRMFSISNAVPYFRLNRMSC